MPLQTGDVNARIHSQLRDHRQHQGQRYLALTVDPTNPNITYLGGFGGNSYNSDTGLIRVDATKVADAHSLVAGNDQSLGST